MPNVADGSLTNADHADIDNDDKILVIVDGVLEEINTSELAQVAAFNRDGVARTMDPRNLSGSPTFSGVDRCVYQRVDGAKASATGVVICVVTSSGNISVAVYGNNGSNGTAAEPSGARKGTTGTIACPSTGFQTVTFTAPVNINKGDWIGISCDNTTAAFGTGPALVAGGGGVSFYQATAHPAPATVGTLVAFTRVLFSSSE